MPLKPKINQFLKLLKSVPNGIYYLLALFASAWQFWQAVNGEYGADPVAYLIDSYGLISFQFLIACLLITPLHRLGLAVSFLRRPLGLISFGFMTAHLLIWLIFDYQLNWAAIMKEITERSYIYLGLLAWIFAIPLALTSNAKSIKWLTPKYWKKLHYGVYIVALLSIVHYYLTIRAYPLSDFLYLAMLVSLVIMRGFWMIARKAQTAPVQPKNHP